MEQLTLEEYVLWLVSVNSKNKAESSGYLPALLFGFVEETYELKEADNFDRTENKLLELGDCIAYYTLIADYCGLSPTSIANKIDSLTSNFNTRLEYTVADYCGKVKRYFRGDSDGSLETVEQISLRLLCACYTLVTLPLDVVTNANKDKLTKRMQQAN